MTILSTGSLLEHGGAMDAKWDGIHRFYWRATILKMIPLSRFVNAYPVRRVEMEYHPHSTGCNRSSSSRVYRCILQGDVRVLFS